MKILTYIDKFYFFMEKESYLCYIKNNTPLPPLNNVQIGGVFL